MNELTNGNFYHKHFSKIRLMFMDESLFGRIIPISHLTVEYLRGFLLQDKETVVTLARR